MDRAACWSQGADTTCVFCKNASETRNHIFFQCSFSSQIWEILTKGILLTNFSHNWDAIVRLIADTAMEKKLRFCTKYAFQVTLYMLWRERNKRRHGDQPIPMLGLAKLIDKTIRNKLSLIQAKGARGFDGILQVWFSTRL